MSSRDIEETANKIMSSDNIITGEMDEYSGRYIVVDNVRYRLCKVVKIFTPLNKMISIKNIGGAEEVKLFRNSGCVRKINVLRFAQ
jgi:hypothetical protein